MEQYSTDSENLQDYFCFLLIFGKKGTRDRFTQHRTTIPLFRNLTAKVRQMLPRIFFAGGLAAAEMTLGKILLEHLFDAQIQFKIDALKPLRDVLMHGGFAGAEGDGAGADRTARLYNIFSAFDRPALNFFPHKKPPPFDKIFYTYVENRRFMCVLPPYSETRFSDVSYFERSFVYQTANSHLTHICIELTCRVSANRTKAKLTMFSFKKFAKRFTIFFVKNSISIF